MSQFQYLLIIVWDITLMYSKTALFHTLSTYTVQEATLNKSLTTHLAFRFAHYICQMRII